MAQNASHLKELDKDIDNDNVVLSNETETSVFSVSPKVTIPAHFQERAPVLGSVLIALNAVVVLCASVAAYFSGSVWAFVAAFILIAACAQGLYILQHELMHNLIYTKKSTNEKMGLIISALLGTRFFEGRAIHMTHHSRVGYEDDPNIFWHQTQTRKPGASIVLFFIAQLFGMRLWLLAQNLLNVAKNILGASKNDTTDAPKMSAKAIQKSRQDLIYFVGVQCAVLVMMCVVTQSLFIGVAMYVGMYVLPLSTLTSLFESIRSFSEHTLPGDVPQNYAEQNRLFFMKSSVFELFFISPYNFHYHHIHHLYPNVVTFKLPELHAWLHENDPDYPNRFMVRGSYVKTMIDYITHKPIVGAGKNYPNATPKTQVKGA